MFGMKIYHLANNLSQTVLKFLKKKRPGKERYIHVLIHADVLKGALHY
jgi:hypothetical protein